MKNYICADISKKLLKNIVKYYYSVCASVAMCRVFSTVTKDYWTNKCDLMLALILS